MADDKKINLMPEDLRGKEEAYIAKPGLHLSPDLSLPGKTYSQPQGKPSGSDVSFWSKLSDTFQPKTKKTVVTDQPSAAHVSTASASTDFETPKLTSPIITSQVSGDTQVSGGERRSNILPSKKPDESGGGPSFWQRLAKLFQGKPKQPKIPPIKAPVNGPILLNNIKKNKQAIPEPEVEVRMPVSAPKPQNFQEFNQSLSPARKVEDILEPSTVMADKSMPSEPEVRPKVSPEPMPAPMVAETRQNDFTIPEPPAALPDKSLPPTEVEIARFHQPSPRIRARLLENGGGVDLIPTAAKVRSWLQIIGLLLLSIVVSLVILALFYGVLYVREQGIVHQQKVAQDKVTQIEKDILNFAELNKNVSALGDEIKLVQDSLNKHIYWTNFFALLEKYTLPDVFYQGLAAGNGGALSLSATTGSYDSVAKQLKILQDPAAQEFVTSASINGARQGNDGKVTFTVNITLNTNLFYYNKLGETDGQ